jgi:hypothetical protein
MSLIVLSIGSPNQCFVNKVDELNKNVPMDVDRVVVSRLGMTWRLTTIPWRSIKICRILWRFTTIPWRSARIYMQYATNDVHMKAF